MNGLKRFLDANKDANFLWAVDSHSCYQTGGLVHGQGAIGAPWVSPADEVSIYHTDILVSCYNRCYPGIREVH